MLVALLVVTVTGCGPADDHRSAPDATKAADAAPSATPKRSPAMARFDTQLPTIAFLPLNRLPANPSRGSLSVDCDQLLTTPESGAGRLAKTLGWGVTAEIRFADTTAVSFVGSAEPATSGACQLANGNVGIFKGGRLLALAYARPSAGGSIGSITPLAAGGARVWDGDIVPRPIADLAPQAGGGFTIGAVAARDPVCNGAAIVPAIYGQPIDRARAALRRAGWNPVPTAIDTGNRDTRVGELAAAGVPEIEDCAGTGFGFCSFAYRGKAGDLSVITVGDGPMPTVSDYRVECRRP
jgi:hypothetical protein